MVIQIEPYADWLRSMNLSERTVKEYSDYLERFNYFNAINQQTVNMFLSYYPQNIVARAFLKSLFYYLKHNPTIVDNIAEIKEIEIPKATGRKKARIPKVLSREEIDLIASKFPKRKLRIMFLITFEGGLRVGELFSITLRSINFEKWVKNPKDMGEIKVLGKGNKEGIALISPETMMELYKWCVKRQFPEKDADRSIWRISGRMSRSTWRDKVWKASEEAIGRRINLHLLRHSRGADLISKGLDIRYIQEYLRHTSISSTQIYTQVSKIDLKKRVMEVDSIVT